MTKKEERQNIIFKHVKRILKGLGRVIWMGQGLLSKHEGLTKFRNLSLMSKPVTVAHI